MITLLIVSIALAAMAPMMSKKIKTTNNTDCLWLKTLIGSNIVRPDGNVGIGMNTVNAPNAKLEIRGDNDIILKLTKNGALGNAVEIYKGSEQVLTVNPDGKISINDQNTSSNDSLITFNGGNWRNAIRREGGFYISALNDNQKVISIQSPSKGETAWINADGSSSFGGVPKGAIVFFNGAYLNPQNVCPTGWMNLMDENEGYWKGRFFRVAGRSNIGEVQEDSAPDLYFQFSIDDNMLDGYSGNAALEFSSTDKGKSLVAKDEWYGKIARFHANHANPAYGRANEVRPKNISLLTCQKL